MAVIRCFNRKCEYWARDRPDYCRHPFVERQNCTRAAIRKDNVHPKNFYLDELLSNQCQCDESKQGNHSFCTRCYYALPGDMQKALYRRVGAGYEDAYDEAVKFLENNVW